jgi:hypothetical protein
MAFALTIEKPGLRYEDAYIKLGAIRMDARSFTAELVFDTYQSQEAADAFKAAVLAGGVPNPADYIVEQRIVGVGPADFVAMMASEVGVGIRALAYQFSAQKPEFQGAESV